MHSMIEINHERAFGVSKTCVSPTTVWSVEGGALGAEGCASELAGTAAAMGETDEMSPLQEAGASTMTASATELESTCVSRQVSLALGIISAEVKAELVGLMGVGGIFAAYVASD